MSIDINEILNKKVKDMTDDEKDQLLKLFKNALNGIYNNEKVNTATQDQLNGLSERVSTLNKQLSQVIKWAK